MRKRSLAVAFLLLGSAFFVGISVTPNARAATLFVGGAGPGNYTTIQGAIAMASPGDTIFVYNGTYNETVMVPNNLSLVGENRYTTVIANETEGGVVRVGHWSTVTGFTVMNTGQHYTDHGISVGCTGCLIAGNRILASEGAGVILWRSWDSIVTDNLVVGNEMGIYVDEGNGNLVTSNILDGGFYGIHVIFSEDLTIANNTIVNQLADGIWLFHGDHSLVYGNDMSHNGRGIWLEGSSHTTVTGNTFYDNWAGIHSSWWSESNRIFHNNFVGNTEQASVHNSTDFWDDGYPSGGNYWSDYNGVDLYRGVGQNIRGGDGIGDTPYIIGEDRQDNYPLMTFPPSPLVWSDRLFGPVRENATPAWSPPPDASLSDGSDSCEASVESAPARDTSPTSRPSHAKSVCVRPTGLHFTKALQRTVRQKGL